MQLEPLERRNVACGVELDRWPRPAPILMNEQQQRLSFFAPLRQRELQV